MSPAEQKLLLVCTVLQTLPSYMDAERIALEMYMSDLLIESGLLAEAFYVKNVHAERARQFCEAMDETKDDLQHLEE